MKTPLFAVVVGVIASTVSAGHGAIAIKGARLMPVSQPEIERGTIVIAEGKILALGKDVLIPAGADVIDGTGTVVYPGLIDALTTLGLEEVGAVASTVDSQEVGDVNPHAKAWVALNPHSELIPVARAGGVTAALVAPEGGLISGQSALIRLTGTTPEALTVTAPVAMHAVFPSGRPAFDFFRMSEEPELKTFEARQKEKRQNQEKDLARFSNLIEEAKAFGAALEQAQAGRGAQPKPDLAMEALASAARGRVPLIVRADAESDIRGAVTFATDHGLRLVIAGGVDAWRCADLLKQKDVAVLLKVDRLPRRESDPYDAPYANAAVLHRAGVRLAIVTDDASNARNLPYEAAMARAFGLPADAALRAITLSPAEILGVADRMGSLDPGKDANLIIATGDIMDHRTGIAAVYFEGREQSLETRHTRLWRQFKGRK